MVGPYSTATQMLDSLRSREISPSELLELHLDRIARYNPELNAIVTSNAEVARARARGGPVGDLGGLPVTIKDSIDVGSLPTTSGDPERRGAIPDQDSPLAARVLGAGAVLLGKTNVPLMTGDWQANNRLFGRTLNPWDHGRTPGGSTGGGAAALAAGLTPLEFGSDIGGSIRIPAAFCGVFGHRPSEGLVPAAGHVPGPAPMGVMGPLARSAADLRLALEVVRARDLPPPRATRLDGLRVAVLPGIDWLPVDSEIAGALEELAARLPNARTTMPAAYDAWEQEGLYAGWLAAVTFSETGEAREKIAETLGRSSEPLAPAMLRGLRAGANGMQELEAERTRATELWTAFFRDFDVLLTPATLVNAFPHDDRPFLQRTVEVNGELQPYKRLEVYAGLAALTGLPATAFPAGQTRGGLPIGLQAIGPPMEDLTSIQFAALLEQELGYAFQAPPTYSGVASRA